MNVLLLRSGLTAICCLLLGLRASGTSTVSDSTPTALVRQLEAQGEFARAWNTLTASAAPNLEAPSSEARRELARDDLRLLSRLGRDDQALEHLQRYGDRLDAGDAALLRAALMQRRGAAAGCLAALQQAAPPRPLRGYARLLEAEASCALQRWPAVRAAVDSAAQDSMPSEMRLRLAALGALAALREGDLQAANRRAPELAAAARRDDRTGLVLVEIGRVALQKGPEALPGWLPQLLEARPAPAESAYALLQQPSASRLAADWSTQLALAHYEIQGGRQVAGRARLLRQLRSAKAPNRDARAEAWLELANAYLSAGDERRCLRTLKSARRDAAGARVEPDLMLLRARTFKRLGRDADAIALYRELARRFPSHSLADNALYEVGWRYETRHKLRRAERAYGTFVRTFPRSPLADDATLRQGLCALRDARPADAAQHFRRLLSHYADSPLADNALYWQMLAQQRLRDAEGALSLRDRLEHDFPRSYFTVLARRRIEHALVDRPARLGLPAESGGGVRGPVALQASDVTSEAQRCQAAYDTAIVRLRRDAQLRPPASYEDESRLWRFLLDHGLALEASWEARRLEQRYANDPGALLDLLARADARGAHERLVRLAFRLGQLLPQPAFAEPLEVLSYPAPYTPLVAESSARHHLSHAAVLGLMRRESAFDTRIDSPAGARGLMQLMPQVARRLASDNGQRRFDPDSLYEPRANVGLGCQLLAHELDESRGNLPQALAAYNAGTEPAAAWAQRLRRGEPSELYIDVVEYLETRTYLKSVLGNLEVYRRVYALQ